jgi:hypothetical protein
VVAGTGVSECGKGAWGQAAALRWGGRRCAPTPLRCSVLRPRRRTRYAVCSRSAQTAAPSQMLMRAARAAASPGLAGRAGPGGPAVRMAQTVPRTVCVRAHLLGTPKARCSLPPRAFAASVVSCGQDITVVSARLAARGAGAFCGAEKRRRRAGARSALPKLTHRHCLSVESAANAASLAMRPGVEHRRGVGAQRRPQQQAPAPRAASRAAHEAGKHEATK